MNNITDRRIIVARSVYRALLCVIGAAVIVFTAVNRAAGLLTPENLSALAVGEFAAAGVSEAPDTGLSSNQLYKSELFIIEDTDYPSDVPKTDIPESAAGALPILRLDLSRNPEAGEIIIDNNETDYEVNAGELLTRSLPSGLNALPVSTLSSADKPLVLILHTHGTECYTPENADYYYSDTSFRSNDTSQNVVAVGDVLADTLNDAGIPTLHCTIMHDAEDFNTSYEKSAQTVIEYINKYPSIKYVFDIHRDAAIRSSGEMVAAVTGEKNDTAQIMFVVGTDYQGADHAEWRDNLALAVKLQNSLNSRTKNIARPISLRGASFNAQYAPGSLLIEVGTCGNTLQEAKNAAGLLADEIASFILGA